MKKRILSITAVCLVLSMLTGCSGVIEYFKKLGQFFGIGTITFSDMQYTRPDMDQFQKVLDNTCAEAATQTNFDKLQNSVLEFYSVYESFYTNYFLATIYYSKDLTNTYWETENNFCSDNSAQVDAGLDRLYRVLAKSPLRDQLEGDDYFGAGFFDNYEGESVYDETFRALLAQETTLVNQYYLISGQSASTAYYSNEYFEIYGTQMAEVFRDLVQVRQEMATHAGYSSYPEFAYDFYHTRDYTVAQAEEYMQQIQQQLVPLYKQLNHNGFWDMQLKTASEDQTYSYVQQMAQNMGGIIADAFQVMTESQLYDISYGANKFNASFVVYLYSYGLPYVFVNPALSEYDKLTFSHEFGHFCNHYASYGSGAGVDVSEVFSQGMEYLSLCYTNDTGNLKKLRMGTCLSTYVEQAAYASFEQQVYNLKGDALTVENIQALYQQVGTDFGLTSWNWDSRDYVCITHFFTSPMYVISYVVSNDAALQLYQMEQTQAGSGLACYTANLASREAYFLEFLESAGLESPFASGRLESVRKTLEEILK